MKTQKTKYVITKKCFVGNEGDKLEVDWNGMDGANWNNLTENTSGCPFVEKDCVKEVVSFENEEIKKALFSLRIVRSHLSEAHYRSESLTEEEEQEICKIKSELFEVSRRLEKIQKEVQ